MTIVNYNKGNQTLELIIDDSFKRMVAIFNHDKKSLKHALVTPIFLNKKHFGAGAGFGSATETSLLNAKNLLKSFKFSDVKHANYQTIKDIKSDIGFEIEGSIYGLTMGNLALYSSDQLQRKCRQKQHGLKDDASTVKLRLFNTLTNETLATYSIRNR